MSKTTEILENDLIGLPAVLDAVLIAHPTWKTSGGDTVCAGPDCDWVKPSGRKSTPQRWRNHLAFELQMAIGEWYDEPEAAA